MQSKLKRGYENNWFISSGVMFNTKPALIPVSRLEFKTCTEEFSFYAPTKPSHTSGFTVLSGSLYRTFSTINKGVIKLWGTFSTRAFYEDKAHKWMSITLLKYLLICVYLITPYNSSNLLILTKSLADTNYFIPLIFLGLKLLKKSWSSEFT